MIRLFFYPDEVIDILKSALFSTRESTNQDYKRGFLACAVAVCLAIGADPSVLKSDVAGNSISPKF